MIHPLALVPPPPPPPPNLVPIACFTSPHLSSGPHSHQYCHYVAGLVGIGLSQLFSASGLESEVVGRDQRLSNSMGLFLQKTNIIRDYLEDTLQGREFWPREVMGHLPLPPPLSSPFVPPPFSCFFPVYPPVLCAGLHFLCSSAFKLLLLLGYRLLELCDPLVMFGL